MPSATQHSTPHSTRQPTRPDLATPAGATVRILLVWIVAVVALGAPFPVVATSPGGDREQPAGGPDIVGSRAGGTAARLHAADGTPLAGDVFLLIGGVGPDVEARVYDATPYTHDRGTHPDTVASNLVALETVRALTGADIDYIEMTHAPDGGPSGGLTRAIAYLDVVSDGAFTGDLRVAATGQLNTDGHLRAIDHIDAKTIAAHLAGADVLFTPTLPAAESIDAFAARAVGEFARDAGTGAALNDARRVEQFRRWGAERPDGMDVVDVRHLIDVSAYLCGAGSAFACEVTELLDQQAQRRLDELTESAGSEADRMRAASGRP